MRAEEIREMSDADSLPAAAASSVCDQPFARRFISMRVIVFIGISASSPCRGL